MRRAGATFASIATVNSTTTAAVVDPSSALRAE